jgi:tyrosine-protein kinase Etk/Wzc
MQLTNRKANENNENNFLSQMLFRYLPYWPLFAALIVVCLGVSYIYLHFYKIPLYETKAAILIKDENKGVDDSRAFQEFNLLTTKKIVENEIEVLQSRALMDPVVKRLGLYAQVFEKDELVSRSAYESSPIRIDVKNAKAIEEQVDVPFSYDEKSLQVIIDNKRYSLNQWVKTPYGELMFTPNNYKSRVPENPLYFSLINPKSVTQSLLSGISVTPSSKLSTVINISLRDESPKRAENILNELLSEYGKSALALKTSLATNTLSFIDERLQLMGNELAEIERKIQQYKSSRSAVDIGTQGKLFLENVSLNDQKLSDINMQMAVLNQVEQYVNSKERAGSIVPSTLGVENPVLTQLLERLYTAELEHERLKQTTAENNPMMLSLADQIEKIKPSILENIRNQRSSLTASKNNIQATNNAYASMLQSIPTKEKELLEISRDQSIKSAIYSFLLQKREEAALSSVSKVSDSRVINQAQSSMAPVSISDKMIYLLFMGIALAIGVAIIAIKEMLNRKVLFRHEIEKLTSLPIVSEIFQEDGKKPIVVEEGKRSQTAEQFRKLRTAFTFMGLDSKRKKVLVTSSISGEGKSFIATNLALSVALTNKKVVLVEADLINPSLSRDLNINNELGLSDYLKGRNEAEEIIKSTPFSSNLFIIPSGPLPNNPSELIVNGKIEELFYYLGTIFDCIIVDAPPVIPVSDAYVLSDHCDATLFVIRHKYTPKIFVQRIDDSNKVNQLKNAAIVFNGIQPRGFNKNYYGYGYGYGYIFKGDDVGKKRKVST